MLLLLNVSMVIGLIVFRGECEKEMIILYLKRVNVYLLIIFFVYFFIL